MTTKTNKTTYKDLNQLSTQQLDQKLIEERKNLKKLRFATAMGPLENPTAMPKSRKTIARIKTIQNQRKNEQPSPKH